MQELGSHVKHQALIWEFRGEMQRCWQKLSRGDWPGMAVLWMALKSESPSVVSNSLLPHGLYSPWNSPGQNTGVGSLSLHQAIFPAEGSNPGLPHCRGIIYQLSHKGSHKRSWFWRRFHYGVCACVYESHSSSFPESEVKTSLKLTDCTLLILSANI